MRHGERGFTLVELVLALSIVAVMITILFGGLRVGLRAWQRGEERANTLEHARSMTQLIEQTLGGAFAFQGQLEQTGQSQVLFQGEPDKLSFVTLSPPFPFVAPIAFAAVTLSIDGGVSAGLAIREKALPNLDPFEAVPPSVVDPTVTAVRFRYLRDPDGGAWEEKWDGQEERTLPRAVEVTITAQINGLTLEQPPITIPIRMVTP